MIIDRLIKNVRFKAQIYTDRGPAIKFRNKYNSFELKIDDIIDNPKKLFSIVAVLAGNFILKIILYEHINYLAKLVYSRL